MNHPFRTLRFGLLVVLLLFIPAAGFAAVSHEARVVKVIDGDSLILLVNEREVECRMIGIDAPEWGQAPWDHLSKEHLEKLLAENRDQLRMERGFEPVDKYGRTLVYLRGKGGQFLNVKMVEDGYALAFVKAPNTKLSSQLKRAQQKARHEKLGIWAEDGLNERPGEFRKRHARENPAKASPGRSGPP